MDWTDEAIARLRVLWAQGKTTPQIGVALGTTKDAVVGRAHRLGLPKRPSPIKRADNPEMAARNAEIARLSDSGLRNIDVAARMGVTPEVANGVIAAHRRKNAAPVTTLPPLASLSPPDTPPAPPRVWRLGRRLEPMRTVVDRAVADARPVAPKPVYGRVVPCCWPIGEPGTKVFRYCDDPSAPGKSYCAHHAGIAYVKVRDRRDDDYAAA